MFASEPSVRIELVLSVLVVALAVWLGVGQFEMVFIVAAAATVLLIEGVNTVLERVADLAEPRYREAVREIKDAMAGVVMLAMIGACGIGLLVLWPYIAQRF